MIVGKCAKRGFFSRLAGERALINLRMSRNGISIIENGLRRIGWTVPVVLLCFALAGCTHRQADSTGEAATAYVYVSADPETDADRPTVAILEEATGAGVEQVVANGFAEDLNPEIKTLIRNYYECIAGNDYTGLTYLVNDSSRLNPELIGRQSDFMEAVKSLTCYF